MNFDVRFNVITHVQGCQTRLLCCAPQLMDTTPIGMKCLCRSNMKVEIYFISAAFLTKAFFAAILHGCVSGMRCKMVLAVTPQLFAAFKSTSMFIIAQSTMCGMLHSKPTCNGCWPVSRHGFCITSANLNSLCQHSSPSKNAIEQAMCVI